jgi:hypothetical protein
VFDERFPGDPCCAAVRPCPRALTSDGCSSQVACPHSTHRLRLPKHLLGAMADALGMGALHIGAAARHADGTRLHAGVRGVPACRRATSPDAHAVRLLGIQGRSPRRHGGGDQRHPRPLCPPDRSAGEAHGDGELKDMKRSKRCEPPRCPQAPRLTPHPRSERAGAWSRPCKCTRDLAVRARRSTLVTRSAAATRSLSLQFNTARRPNTHIHCFARRQRRPRAPAAQELPLARCGILAARRPDLKHGSRRRVSTSWQHRTDQGEGERGERPR